MAFAVVAESALSASLAARIPSSSAASPLSRPTFRPRLPARRHPATAAAAEGSPSASRPVRPSAPTPPSAPVTTAVEAPPPATSAAPAAAASAVSLEYQRQKAKELVAYFQEKKFEEASSRGSVFGWTRPNEVGNGRWVMFGLLVGLLTEYATGVNFPSQIALVLENLGVID